MWSPFNKAPTPSPDSMDREEDVVVAATPTEDFINHNHPLLDDSMKFDKAVGSFLCAIQETSLCNDVEYAVGRISKEQGVPLTDGEVVKAARQYTNSYLNFVICGVRRWSESGSSFRGNLKAFKYFQDGPSDASLLVRQYLQPETLHTVDREALSLVQPMLSAETSARQLLTLVASELLSERETAESLHADTESAFYADDPYVREIASLIKIDWHRPARNLSVLRQHFNVVEGSTTPFLPPFARLVAGADERTKLYGPVKDAAKLALRYAKHGEDDDDVHRFILENAHVWQQNRGAESAFEVFIVGEIRGIQGYVERIAGSPSFNSFRKYLSDKDYATLVTDVNLYKPFASRSVRSMKGNRRQTEAIVRSDNELSRRLESEMTPPSDSHKKIGVLRGSEIVTFETPAELAKYFAGNGSNQFGHTVADYEKMAAYLTGMQSYISGGTKLLRDHTLQVNGKTLPLLRLAPDKTPGLKLHDRFLRAVFAISGETIIIQDMMTHEAFTGKYSI